MKSDIWTFLFQIINFVVLLFILKRLLYKPIRDIIEKRRALIGKTVEDAERTKKEALELKEKQQEELKNLKELQTQILEKTREEAAAERKKLLSDAEKEAGKIIEKEKAIFDAGKRRIEKELKDKAIEIISIFASNLLGDISDEELHKAIYRKLLKENGKIVSDISKIKEEDAIVTLNIITAFPLNDDDVKRFQSHIESLTTKKVLIKTIIDKTLIAGVKIKVYDRMYDFSLTGQIDTLKSRLKETA